MAILGKKSEQFEENREEEREENKEENREEIEEEKSQENKEEIPEEENRGKREENQEERGSSVTNNYYSPNGGSGESNDERGNGYNQKPYSNSVGKGGFADFFRNFIILPRLLVPKKNEEPNMFVSFIHFSIGFLGGVVWFLGLSYLTVQIITRIFRTLLISVVGSGGSSVSAIEKIIDTVSSINPLIGFKMIVLILPEIFLFLMSNVLGVIGVFSPFALTLGVVFEAFVIFSIIIFYTRKYEGKQLGYDAAENLALKTSMASWVVSGFLIIFNINIAKMIIEALN